MKPIDFAEKNVVMGAGQLEYQPLPALRLEDGQVWTVWKFTWRERLRILFRGRMYLCQHTFNQPMQPILPMVKSPFNPKTWR